MAQKVSFDAYLGWVNITNPNQIPADARVIGANDLLRYEKLGQDTAKKFLEVDQTLDGMKSDVVISDLIADANSETRYVVDSMVKAGVTTGVAKFQKVIDEVPAKVQEQVTPLVAKAIAADGTVASAAAAAVAKDIAGRDILEGSDARIPTIGAAAGTIFVVVDADRRQTWLGVNSIDGGPSDWSLQLMRRSLGVGQQDAPGYLFAVTDADRRLTDLAIRDTDGQFADFVVDRLRPRILKGAELPEASKQRVYADMPMIPGSDIFPAKTDMRRAAGWGSSSMQGIDAKLGALFTGRGAAYYAGGKGGEIGEQTAARLGAIPALVNVSGGVVPASGPVEVTTPNVPRTGSLRAFDGTLAGIPGTLSYQASPVSYIFTRTTPGTATPVPNGTPFIPVAESYRDALNVLWIGKNNITTDPRTSETVLQITAKCVDWLAPLQKRFFVLGHFADSDTAADSLERVQIIKTNEGLAARYGRAFIDVYAYIKSPQVWADTGITPTAADLEAQRIGNKAPSLSQDNAHLNGTANTAITALIAARLNELGWN